MDKLTEAAKEYAENVYSGIDPECEIQKIDVEFAFLAGAEWGTQGKPIPENFEGLEDGKDYLVWYPKSYRWVTATFFTGLSDANGSIYNSGFYGVKTIGEPTHYMELPQPPKD